MSDSAAAREALTYWTERLRGVPPTLDLPMDGPLRAGEGRSAGHIEIRLPARLAERLRSVGERQRTSLSTVLLSTYAVLLARHTRQRRLIIAVPHHAPDGTPATLPLTFDFSGDPAFTETLRATCTGLDEARSHGCAPLEDLARALRLAPDPSRPAIAQAGYLYTDRLPEAPAPDWEESVELGLRVQDGPDGVTLSLVHRLGVIDVATARRMADCLLTLLGGVAEASGQRVFRLPMLPERELRTVLDSWSTTTTGRTGDDDRCLHQLVAEQAARTPRAPAVSAGTETLTYAQLDASANRLARHLREAGAAPDAPVAVCLRRGETDAVVAMLAVLKAGAAYLPLDPDYPEDRLRHMLGDSGTRTVITNSGALPVSLAQGVQVIDADRQRPAITERSAEPLPVTCHPDGLAYVIYTSGSTGRPKGTSISHRSAVNLALAQRETLEVHPGDRVLQFASPSFDASVWEIVMALSAGAELVLPTPEEAMAGPGLATLLKTAGITHVTLPPSVLSQLDPEEFPALRVCVSAGEACPADLPRRWASVPRFVNAYGPTEATVCATMGDVVHGPDDAPEADRSPSIGRPVPNTRVYVLDSGLEPVPVGVTGELCLAGPGLARGYLGQAATTARHFLPDPYGPSGSRLYRTGDLARWNPDGTLQYLGRSDYQVKIRGHRIEPGEIEATLRRHPAIHDAAVAVRPGPQGHPRLVAYAVPAGRPTNHGAILDELRVRLRERLPAYMVPADLLLLDHLPLTPNGKVDRSALPEPERPRGSADHPPRTAAEHELHAFWTEILQTDRIGVTDDFFALGGDSLLAARLITRIQERLGVRLPVRAVFDEPTIEGLAPLLEQAGPTSQPRTPGIAPRDPERPAHASFVQERFWFLERLRPGTAVFNLPTALRLRGELDLDTLRAALTHIVTRHEILRTSLAEEDGGPVLRVSDLNRVPLAIEDVRGAPAAAVTSRIEEAARAPFEPSAGPLFATTLLKVAEREHVLVLVLHHAVADAWSMRVLYDELAETYAAFREGRPPRLTDLPVQYPDFAVWQRAQAHGEHHERQLAHWKEVLDGVPAVLDLPTDRPRPAEMSYRGGRVRFRLPAPLVTRAGALGRAEGATPFMVLCAAFAVLLSRYGGGPDLVVGTSPANRPHRTEELIGPFVNTVPLRVGLDGRPSFRQLLGRVRETTLGALANLDVPFELIVEAVDPERSLGRPPLAQVTFNLHTTGARPPRIPGVEVEPLGVDTGTSRFELELALWDDGNGLAGELDYNADLFEQDTAQRLAAHYGRLLEALVEDPEREALAAPLMDDTERDRLLTHWGDGGPGHTGPPLPLLFQEQARRTPDAAAVVAGDQRLTYRELNGRVERLAHRLRAHGAGPEKVVGVCLPRTAELLVALLATLRAGAAYLPLDPDHPAARISALLADANAHAVLVAEGTGISTEALGVPAIDIGAESTPASPADGLPSPHPDGLAYVIYTSGSTGRPKGVAITHRGLSNYLQWARTTYRGAAGGVAPVATSVAYDMAVTPLFVPLISGGTVELMPSFTDDPEAGVALLGREQAPGLLKVTPSHLRALLSQPGPADELSWPETLVVGGEQLSTDVLRRWREAGGPCEIHNEYGPTETVVGVCVHRCAPAELPSDGQSAAVPVGRPVAGTRLYVLDDRLEPVPQGVAGELYIGGEGVARGYLGRPGTTAGVFLPDPVSGIPGSILYRTGDLVRHRPDGTLEFLGRKDGQIKLRGFRLELGEVEAALRRHPAVQQAVVLADVRQDSEPRLTACLVAHDGAQVPATGQLRDFLRGTLPEHAVPAAYAWIEAIPLTRNGKVDQAALRAVRADLPAEPTEVPPGSRTEQALVDIWSRMLGRDRIGVDENFFDAGGNSLLAVRMHRELSALLAGPARSDRIPLVAVFRHPTIRALARFLEAAPAAGAETTEAAVQVGTERAAARRAARSRRVRRSGSQDGR
ncbi:amino acid adenylation domain-containing protein [Streptomyces sp. NPDC101151]|uniref:amino acid adenylation domain-containing protein n=1 Tax=Streptomyces sp. NPDC101151 TaxID=3366115 RepID=UPI00380EAC34